MASTVSLTINNTSGIDLVIAFVQGASKNQSVDMLNWLNFNNTTTWEAPNQPKTNSDLAPYMKDVKNGSSVTISIPAYSELVGFRCLLADVAYKKSALQKLTTGNNTTYYMAFPDLMTADYVFDKFEAGLTKGTPGIWNITSVDFLGIPLQLSKGAEIVGYMDGVTSEGMFKLLAKLSTPYNKGNTQSPNTAKNVYRFFSPAHIDAANTCLDTQITSGLKNLQTNTTTVNYGADVFSNFTTSSKTVTDANGNSSVIGTVSCTSKLNGAITVDDLTTLKAFAGTVSITGNSSQVVLGALLASAICRGVLGNPKNWGDIVYASTQCSTPWSYYPTGLEFDEYSKLIHLYSINNKNYGFSYDDFFGDEAGFNVIPGESVTLNVLPISGTMTASANPSPTKKTGCLAVTIPDGITANLGSLSVNGVNLDAVGNTLCFLDDQVIIKFTNYPSNLTSPEVHVDLKQTSPTAAITYWENGQINTGLSISGLAYNPTTRQLSFGTQSKWT